MNTLEPTGIDLARAALKAARKAAGQRAEDPPAYAGGPRRAARRSAVDGRDPIDLHTALEDLMSARAWEIAAEAANVRALWPAIEPDLAVHVSAVGFDPETGQLDLLPDSSAYETHLRLTAPTLVRRLNEALRVDGLDARASDRETGAEVIRTIRVLAHAGVTSKRRPTSEALDTPHAKASPPREPSIPAERRATDTSTTEGFGGRTRPDSPATDTLPILEPIGTGDSPVPSSYTRAVRRARAEKAMRKVG
ncbi:DciA family protein [Embleya sp. MST-111070]|uniref:DciA family protein n=1 Tax=Embleya sp. MST-111070 TaxID=3398231 RepID=UPI003F73EEF3